MKFSADDIKMIRKFEEIKNRGLYCDSGQLNDVYNRVLETNAKPTSCGSCMRGRIQQLVDALNRFEEICKRQEEIKASEALKQEQVDNVPSEENNATGEAKKRVGRPKKE